MIIQNMFNHCNKIPENNLEKQIIPKRDSISHLRSCGLTWKSIVFINYILRETFAYL